ncbi:MAG: 30S ribosomal protein S18 [Vampirovibrionales bacterium]
MADNRKKRCYFSSNRIQYIDFKDAALLRRFLTDSGKILSRRITGLTSKKQSALKNAVKRARAAGLLPYTIT